MAFQKYTRSESVEPVSPEENTKVAGLLNKLGKTSAADLDDTERDQLREAAKEDDQS